MRCSDFWSRELQQRYGHHWLPSVLWMQEGTAGNRTILGWSNDAYLKADLRAVRRERIAMFHALRQVHKTNSTRGKGRHAKLRIPGDVSTHAGSFTEDGEVFEAPTALYEETLAQMEEREATPISLFARSGRPRIVHGPRVPTMPDREPARG